jgi:archaeosine synthase
MNTSTLILNYGKCRWGSCLFCGYGKQTGKKPDATELKKEFDRFFNNLKPDTDAVKVFGSGSFLDERQIPAEARRYFIQKCVNHNIKEVTIESRPEFISKEKLGEFDEVNLTVAIGLETADDELLEKLYKGFTRLDYENAVKVIREVGAKVRTYLLVNPPYVEDIRKNLDESVEYALQHSDSIVLINLLPHRDAPLFRQWIAGEWSFLDQTQFNEMTAGWKDDPRVELDYETFSFTPRFPDYMRKPLKGVGEEYLTHPYFEAWHDYIIRFYQPPDVKRILLFLPCSFKKPYSESATHKSIIDALEESGLREGIHEVMISNAGVIPREFEGEYPFNAYDWDERLETPEIKERYIQVTSERIVNYLRAHGKNYDRTACYLNRKSESYKAVVKACEVLAVECPNLLTPETDGKLGDRTSSLRKPEALRDFREGLRRLLPNST